MNIEEKIQFYRKKAGLSQEELGQLLLVSRQTISLWETGQTMPTVDNLLRLRDIFGVSVDEMLGVAEDGRIKARSADQCEVYELADAETATKITLRESAVGILLSMIILLSGAAILPLCFFAFSGGNAVCQTVFSFIGGGAFFLGAVLLFYFFKDVYSSKGSFEGDYSYTLRFSCGMAELLDKNGCTVASSEVCGLKCRKIGRWLKISVSDKRVYLDRESCKESTLQTELNVRTRAPKFTFVLCAVLMLSLSLSLIFVGVLRANGSADAVSQAEFYTGMSLEGAIGTSKKENVGLVGTAYVSEIFECYYNEQRMAEIERHVFEDERFVKAENLSSVTDLLIGEMSIYGGAEYAALYCISNGKYNAEAGTEGEFLLILCFAPEDMIRIVVFDCADRQE